MALKRTKLYLYILFKCFLLFFVTNIKAIEDVRAGVKWENIRCSVDTQQASTGGKVRDISRFPWFGVVQHTFYLGGKTRFAVTSGVLIHPSHAIAPAEDIARIQFQNLENNTKFIVWQSETLKYSLDIESYYLAPEYLEAITWASLALLKISTFGDGSRAPVLPVCLPTRGAAMLTDLFAVKMTDDNGEIEKELVPMKFVDSQECEEFYHKNKLNYKKMSPLKSICAKALNMTALCVWDGGVALITRQVWGFWKLIGFSVRGPGCGAPTRFINIIDHLFWIDEMISQVPYSAKEEDQPYIYRRVSPIKIILYKAKVRLPKDIGVCDRKKRGQVLYKDNTEVLSNKNFAQGFFFVSMAQVAQVNCVQVTIDATARTNAAVWIEHHCHRDFTGDRLALNIRDYKQFACFVYFKSVTFVEFHFHFSFKAMVEVTMFGREEIPKFIPNPFYSTESTYHWQPTFDKLRKLWFVPQTSWWWAM